MKADDRHEVARLVSGEHDLIAIAREYGSHLEGAVGRQPDRLRRRWQPALARDATIERNIDDTPPVGIVATGLRAIHG